MKSKPEDHRNIDVKMCISNIDINIDLTYGMDFIIVPWIIIPTFQAVTNSFETCCSARKNVCLFFC